MLAILVNICRAILGLTFIFSGYVKATDPLGSQYKIHDYLEALGLASFIPDWLTLIMAIGLAAVEFSMGIFTLFAMRRHATSKLMLAFMAMMTAITVWIAIANPVSDCGCFGDAIILTNVETLIKNIVLLACSVMIFIYPQKMVRFISRPAQWIAVNYTVLFSIVSSILSLYLLPPFDFRPYYIGADIAKGMEIPEGAEQPEFETTFVLEKDGKKQTFTIDNYPERFFDTSAELFKSHTSRVGGKVEGLLNLGVTTADVFSKYVVSCLHFPTPPRESSQAPSCRQLSCKYAEL